MALINSVLHTVYLAELFERFVMALMGRALFFLFVLQVVLVNCTTTITSSTNQPSPVTLNTGDDITLTCSSDLDNPTYMWDTALTNGDGSSVNDETSSITGQYLHGKNIGAHMCTATGSDTTESASYQILLQGTSVWYSLPSPGGVIQDNVAIAVSITVNEIRCYSPDMTSSNDNTVIVPPSSSNSLLFGNNVAGKIIKTGGTSINDIDVGVYTCRYSNEGVMAEVNFAIYSRDREPGNGGTPLTISSIDYDITGTTMVVTCISTGWPATTVKWTKGTTTLSGGSTYSFDQTVTNRSESTYENTLTVMDTDLSGLLGTYGCEIEAVRHDGDIIDSTTGTVYVQSAGDLIMSVSTLEETLVGDTYDLNCSVTIDNNTPTLTWKKGETVLTNDSSNGITIGQVINSGQIVTRTLTVGPLSQSHAGEYSCSAVEGDNSGAVAVTVNVEIPPPVIILKNNHTSATLLGTKIVLECSITVPSALSGIITNITWYFGNTVVTNGVSTMLNQGESSLDLGIILTAEAGTYTCTTRVVSQYIDVDTDVSSSDTTNITVQLPQITQPIFSPSPVSFPYYSGTQRGFTCQFLVDDIADKDTNVVLTQEYSKMDAGPIQFDSRLVKGSIKVLHGSKTFSGSVTFKYLTLMDEGVYYCEVFVKSTFDNEFILTTTDAAMLVINNVTSPIPDVVMTSSALRFPDHDDYNDQTITCTGILPLTGSVDELEFDKEFRWYEKGLDVTSKATDPSDPEEIVSVSTLDIELSQIGEAEYRCNVSIQIPTDPLIMNGTTFSVTVLGSATPNPPINLNSFDIQYNKATIQWTVSILAYTPEQYFVLYGISESSLTNTSVAFQGGTDFDAVNEQYQGTITDLMFNTVYYYRVRATNTDFSAESDVGMFKTKERPPTAPPEAFNITVINTTALDLSWDAPPEDQRNGDITNYTLSCDEMVGDSSLLVDTIPFPLLVAETGSVSLVYDGFRPGTPITCSVRASNFAGTGPPAIETVTTLEEPPAASPQNFMITSTTSRSFYLSWSEPDPFLQHGVITSYNITCKETDLDTIPSSYPRVCNSSYPYPSSVAVDDLRPNTEYLCSLIAINSAGSSDPVNATGKTVEDVPDGAPNQFAMTAINSTAFNLTWQPIDTLLQNGVILAYTIQCNTSMIPLTEEVSPDSALEDSMGEYNHFISDFSPSIDYRCVIFANTSVGPSPVSSATGRTFEESPDTSPVNVTIIATSSSYVTVSWLPPLVPNGLIIQYTLYITIIDCPDGTMDSTGHSINDRMEYEITGLSPYQQIQIQVSASTVIGEGPRSSMEVGRSGEEIPDQVQGVRSIPVSHSTLTVAVPIHQDVSIARGVITEYYCSIVRYDDSRAIQDATFVTGLMGDSYCIDEDDLANAVGSDLYNFTFTNLVSQTPYNVSINASNSAGHGEAVMLILFTQEGVPPQLSNVTVDRINDTAMTVTWELISITEANGHILGYTMTYSPDSTRTRQAAMFKMVGPNDNQVTVNDLMRGVSYTVTVSASTMTGDGPASETISLSSSIDETKSSLNPAVIIIPIILIIIVAVLIVVVAIAIILVRKRFHTTSLEKVNSSDFELGTYTQDEEIEKTELNGLTSPPVNDYVTDPTAITLDDRLKPIPKSVFSQHVKEMHKDRDRGFELEYQSLTNPTIIPHEAAEHPANRAKNRFANIKPFDFSRVVLKMIEGVEGSDYINASYMDGYNKRDSYIAAQGPLTNTVVDFWRMIWEHKLDTIVMLTKCKEGGKRKCEEYWPEQIHEPKDMGCSISVTLTSVTPYADFEKKIFRVQKEDEPDSKAIDVIHWHFLGWPDHGVPLYATSLISFIRHVRKNRGKHGPAILTHCSAGVGRTGTFILLDSMLERLLVEDTLNVYEFLRQMRSKRVFMVQTVQQYVFIHDALDELITCGDTDITIQTLKNKIEHLHKIIPGKGCSGFDSQFQLIGQVCRKPTDPDCSDALTDANQQKNRYPDRLPYNICRTRLRPTGAPGSDYVNASFIDGYKLRNAYIATPGPMINTVHDFWRMIWEFKSKAIVQLCQLEENGIEVCYQYWPTRTGEPMQFNRLIVTLQSENKKLGYYVRKFEIKEDRAQPTSFVVTQYQYTEWSEHSCPVNYENMLVLLEDLNKVQRSSGNKPITVMCNDGMGRSGTFICVHAQQDRMKTEAVVDIFHYIKSIRIQRAGLVADLEQFIFCHQTLTKFYGRFDSYSNFNC